MAQMWGIHNDALGAELVKQGFISIGWEMPDLAQFTTREEMKAELVRRYPHAKPGAIPVWAGILYRFAREMREGDYVVAPYKANSTLNLGIVRGPYEFHPDVSRHPHRRRVEWVRTGVARGLFPRAALNEIGSAMTLFRIRNNDAVFRQYLAAPSEEVFENAAPTITDEASEEQAEDEITADRVEQHTRDFIVQVLSHDLTHEEFELFTADLLRAMGYQARVTPYSADGGVDVIAHRDPLGLEPPLVKVQCKHTSATQGRPEVQRLIGTLAAGEVGLFVTLGSYSAEAMALERERENLRLLSGADVTRLTVQHYSALPPTWRDRMPLRSLLVVDRPAEGA